MNIPFDYVVATFEPEDVEYRIENKKLLDYINEHDLMSDIVAEAVNWLREWLDFNHRDEWQDALDDALEHVIGNDKLDELEEW